LKLRPERAILRDLAGGGTIADTQSLDRRRPDSAPLPGAKREQSAQEALGGPEVLGSAADEVGDEVRVAHVFFGDLPVALANADVVDVLVHAGVGVHAHHGFCSLSRYVPGLSGAMQTLICTVNSLVLGQGREL
jgi:hypothetical protein